MAATEGFQIGVINLAYDPLIVRRTNFTDVQTRVLTRVDFYRIASNVLICSVIVNVATIDWNNGAFPAPTNINLTKGITVMTLT